MNAQEMKASPYHEHVYAIIRYESNAGEDVPIEVRITVKKIVTDPQTAEQEVRRLNELNKDKGSYYFAQVTRMENASSPTPAGTLSMQTMEEGLQATHPQ